jgi:hypothetical protein
MKAGNEAHHPRSRSKANVAENYSPLKHNKVEKLFRTKADRPTQTSAFFYPHHKNQMITNLGVPSFPSFGKGGKPQKPSLSGLFYLQWPQEIRFFPSLSCLSFPQGICLFCPGQAFTYQSLNRPISPKNRTPPPGGTIHPLFAFILSRQILLPRANHRQNGNYGP